MASSGMLGRAAVVRIYVSVELSASIIRVTANVVPSSPNLVTLMMEALRSSETSVLQQLHGVTSQKTQFFIVTSVKTSNLT
jgi:hypothetical protein